MKLNYQLQSWSNPDDRTPVLYEYTTQSGKQGSKSRQRLLPPKSRQRWIDDAANNDWPMKQSDMDNRTLSINQTHRETAYTQPSSNAS